VTQVASLCNRLRESRRPCELVCLLPAASIFCSIPVRRTTESTDCSRLPPRQFGATGLPLEVEDREVVVRFGSRREFDRCASRLPRRNTSLRADHDAEVLVRRARPSGRGRRTMASSGALVELALLILHHASTSTAGRTRARSQRDFKSVSAPRFLLAVFDSSEVMSVGALPGASGDTLWKSCSRRRFACPLSRGHGLFAGLCAFRGDLLFPSPDVGGGRRKRAPARGRHTPASQRAQKRRFNFTAQARRTLRRRAHGADERGARPRFFEASMPHGGAAGLVRVAQHSGCSWRSRTIAAARRRSAWRGASQVARQAHEHTTIGEASMTV